MPTWVSWWVPRIQWRSSGLDKRQAKPFGSWHRAWEPREAILHKRLLQDSILPAVACSFQSREALVVQQIQRQLPRHCKKKLMQCEPQQKSLIMLILRLKPINETFWNSVCNRESSSLGPLCSRVDGRRPTFSMQVSFVPEHPYTNLERPMHLQSWHRQSCKYHLYVVLRGNDDIPLGPCY